MKRSSRLWCGRRYVSPFAVKSTSTTFVETPGGSGCIKYVRQPTATEYTHDILDCASLGLSRAISAGAAGAVTTRIVDKGPGEKQEHLGKVGLGLATPRSPGVAAAERRCKRRLPAAARQAQPPQLRELRRKPDRHLRTRAQPALRLKWADLYKKRWSASVALVLGTSKQNAVICAESGTAERSRSPQHALQAYSHSQRLLTLLSSGIWLSIQKG